MDGGEHRTPWQGREMMLVEILRLRSIIQGELELIMLRSRA
jgi:hypothetical protein